MHHDPTQPPSEARRTKRQGFSSVVSENQIPVLVLAVLGALAILGLIVLSFAPGNETQFIQNTLGTIAVASVAAIAGLVKGGSA